MQFMSRDMVMLFHTTFNNISVIWRWSVLLIEETGVPGENHTPSASHWLTLSHNVKSSTSRLNRIWTHNVSACQNRICSHHYMTKKNCCFRKFVKNKIWILCFVCFVANRFCLQSTGCSKQKIMKRKFKWWWSAIPSISTK
jgi:hypothetical protein